MTEKTARETQRDHGASKFKFDRRPALISATALAALFTWYGIRDGLFSNSLPPWWFLAASAVAVAGGYAFTGWIAGTVAAERGGGSAKRAKNTSEAIKNGPNES
jgi:hypothetical protein